MRADAGPAWLTTPRRRILRLALLLSFFLWLFVRPLRDGVSMWVPFVAFAGVEVHFFASGSLDRRRRLQLREEAEREEEHGHRAELDPRSRHDLPAAWRGDRDDLIVVDDVLVRHLEDAGRDGDEVDGFPEGVVPSGTWRRAWPYETAAVAFTAVWVAVDAVRVVPAVLVLAAISWAAASFLHRTLDEAGHVVRHRHPVARHLRSAAALAVVAVAVFLAVRPTGWDALTPAQRAAGEQVFAREASRIVGRTVSVTCDSAGAHTGVRNDADGAAVVGGRTAWLAPHVCMALYDRALRGRTDAFDATSWAIVVLAHESWHLRGVANEGLANCFGMQSGVETARRLGLGAGTAARMMRYQYDLNESEFSLGRAEYLLPPECRNGGRYDLDAKASRFP